MTQARNVNLCIAAPAFPPVYGGAQMRFRRYLPGLRDRGIHTCVFTGTATAKDHVAYETYQQWLQHPLGSRLQPEIVGGSLVHRTRLPERKGLKRSAMFLQELLAHSRDPASRPDVLQFVTNLRPRALPWLWRLRRLGIPTLYAVTLPPAQAENWRTHRFRLATQRLMYNSLAGVVVGSRELAAILRDMGVRVPIAVIPNGVDLQRFRPASDAGQRSSLRRAWGYADNEQVVLAVGAICARKGSHLLLAAWRSIEQLYPQARLLFVGPGAEQIGSSDGAFSTELTAAFNRLACPERVKFVTGIEDIEQLYRCADLLVLASDREGMPNSVLEAMATELPVLLTPYLGLSGELGRSGVHFETAHRDPASIGDGIAALLAHPERSSALGRRAGEWLRQTMSLEDALSGYSDFYRELARRAPTLPPAADALRRPCYAPGDLQDLSPDPSH
jgi:glycosyltransferase involved in cell wall biosynthesis